MNISKDIEKMLEETGWKIITLAKHANVDRRSIDRILRLEDSENVVDRLIPFIYGDKRPPALPKKHQKPFKLRKKKTSE